MKAINFLLLSLIISIAFSCVTPQPKSRANLVAKGRNSNLNGFGEITGRVIDSESKYLLPGANVILLDTKLGRQLIGPVHTKFRMYRPTRTQ